MHQLPPYERMQQMRARRAEAAAMVQKSASLAGSFAAIQQNQSQATGDLISKIAMQRIYKKA
ncbi:hypothetical protein [Devosia lucknowensis]|nr:hypothetical protein [Devosia lucknowensis]